MAFCNVLIVAGVPWALVRIIGLIYASGHFTGLCPLDAVEFFAGVQSVVITPAMFSVRQNHFAKPAGSIPDIRNFVH